MLRWSHGVGKAPSGLRAPDPGTRRSFAAEGMMRFSVGAALALLVGLGAPTALADDYGEKICRQYGARIPMDCACAGPPLAEEYDEDELTMVIQFLNNAADPNAKFEELFELEKKFGK